MLQFLFVCCLPCFLKYTYTPLEVFLCLLACPLLLVSDQFSVTPLLSSFFVDVVSPTRDQKRRGISSYDNDFHSCTGLLNEIQTLCLVCVFCLIGSCRTRSSTGNCCVFPFIYRGRRYNRCTRVRSKRPWCAITPNYDHDKLYGYCGGRKRKK